VFFVDALLAVDLVALIASTVSGAGVRFLLPVTVGVWFPAPMNPGGLLGRLNFPTLSTAEEERVARLLAAASPCASF